MDTTPLQIKFSSKEAQADLLALSKALDTSARAADKMDQAFARVANSTSANLSRAAKSMEKYAQVAALLSKIKVAGNPVAQVRELASALDALGKVRGITDQKVANIRELGAALTHLKAPANLMGVSTLLNALGRAKIPTAAQSQNLRSFLSAIGTFRGVPNSNNLERLLSHLAQIRVPNGAAISRLERLFTVMGGAKDIPGATRIVEQLNAISAAATRAGASLNSMPRGYVSSRGAGSSATRAIAGSEAEAMRAARGIAEAEKSALKARTSFSLLGNSLGDLSGRFRISYQLGTMLSVMFASFTIGTFVRSIYEANVQFLKLQKAVLFSTGSFEDANRAMEDYVAIEQRLGLSISENIEYYGRFLIAARAANLTHEQTNKIYSDIETALQVVGASSQQASLALYGLTEMMQKGVVYSKEFNRQIGAQLPGNAVLGARALSQLLGRAVSVAEFFERMHKGDLLSPSFVPAWAEEVRKMYEPLLALAQKRPDVAITRLKNAFTIFAREVGQGKFMTAIGSEINKLTERFVTFDKEGRAHLTPMAQHLADTLGGGLTKVMHTLGNAIGWVCDHIDTLTAAFKAFAGYMFFKEFERIGASAMNAMKRMVGFSNSVREITATEVASQNTAAAIEAAGTSRMTTAAVVKRAAPATAAATVLTFGKREPTSTFASLPRGYRAGERAAFSPLGSLGATPEVWAAWAAQYGMPASAARQSVTQVGGRALRQTLTEAAGTRRTDLVGCLLDALSGASLSRAAIANPFAKNSRVAGTLDLGKMLGSGASTALSRLPGILGAVAVAMAVFSDKASGLEVALDKGGKAAVTYGDILSGIWTSISDSFNDFWKSTIGPLKVFGEEGPKLGNVVIIIYSAVKTVVSILFDLAHAIGTIIGGAIRTLVEKAKTIGEVFNDLVHLDFTSARKHLAQGRDRQDALGVLTGDIVGEDFKKIFGKDGFNSNYRSMLTNSQNAARERTGHTAETDADQKQIEAAMRQQAASQTIEQAAQTFSDATAGMDDLAHKIDPDKLLNDIISFGKGQNLYAGMSTAERASLGAVANQDVIRTVRDAAQKEGIDPTLLLNLGMSETHFDPKQYGWNKGGTSARGPFQLTSGALADLKRAGYDVSDPFHLGTSAPLAAAYLRMSQEQFKKTAGRDLLPYEALLPYKLGGAGAGKLVKTIEGANGDMNVLARDLFPKAAVAPANHSLFYSGSNNAPLTAYQLYGKIVGMGMGSTPNQNGETGEISATMPQQEGGASNLQKTESVAENSYKKFMAVIGQGSPAAAADAKMQEDLIKIKEAFAQMREIGAKHPFMKTFLGDEAIQNGLKRAIEEIKRRASEATDPIGKMNRLNAQANDISELRVKGLEDEASYQEEVNKLIEQGYLRKEVDTEAAKVNWKANADRTRLLSAELDLRKQLVDIDLKKSNNDATSTQKLINEQVSKLPGETFQDKYAYAQRTGILGTFTKGAKAQTDLGTSDAMDKIQTSLEEQTATQHMNASTRALREDYKKYLQDLSLDNEDSLAQLEARYKDLTAVAMDFAKQKQALDNPPGFQKWADALEPLSKRMEDIKANFAEGLSNTITDGLMGKKMDWKSLFDGFRQQWMKAQVDNVLSNVYQAVGLVQPQTPEQQMSAASNTFASATTRFGSFVERLIAMAANDNASGAVAANDNSIPLSYAATGTGGSVGSYSASIPSLTSIASGAGISIPALNAMRSMAPRMAARSSFSSGNSVLRGSIFDDYTVGDRSSGASSGGWSPDLSEMVGVTGQYGALGGSSDPLNEAVSVTGVKGALGGFADPLDEPVTVTGKKGALGSSGGSGGGLLGGIGRALGLWGNDDKNGQGGGLANILMSGLGLFGGLFGGDKKPLATYHMPNGIIGAMSQNKVDGTQVDAKGNVVGGLLNMMAQQALSFGMSAMSSGGSGSAAGGDGLSGVQTAFTEALENGGGLGIGDALMQGTGGLFGIMPGSGMLQQLLNGNIMGVLQHLFSSMGSLGSLFQMMPNMGSMFAGSFSEGGYSTEPVSRKLLSAATFRDVPHFAEGTSNTSGIPAVLHPNEAVVPLSRNRKIPVEGGTGGPTIHVNSSINVVTPNADSFRSSGGSILREQNRQLRRAAVRNLTAAGMF